MNYPSAVKEQTRRFLKNHLGVSLYYSLRDRVEKEKQHLYDRKKVSAIKQKLASRNVQAIADDLEFMEFLHRLFPRMESGRDDLVNLFAGARITFNEISAHGVALENARLLDIGCGRGENLLVANEYGVKFALGIDYNPECRKVFEEFKNGLQPSEVINTDYLSCDLLNANLESDSFDVVTSIASFEHFDDPEGVLNSCHRVLKRSGVFFANFDPIFPSPFGAHRFGTTGIPDIQNLFSDQTVFAFLESKRADNLIHPSKRTPLSNHDPYAEMNRWTVRQFDQQFNRPDKWEVIYYRRRHVYDHYFMSWLFRNELAKYSEEDLFTAGITVLLRKK